MARIKSRKVLQHLHDIKWN